MPPPSKLDPSSPFFLGPQDRPGDFITPTRLTHDNYADWAFDIRLTLVAGRKFGFLDGSIIKPEPPALNQIGSHFVPGLFLGVLTPLLPR